MSKKMPRNNKFKILVCPFTPLDIDRHNHLSTTDMRLIRRIVRDNRTRGRKVEDTLREWPLVKKGESKNIFPFEYDVDQVINTAYAYEIGILRVYVEPLLYSVPIDSKYYEEARRLLGTLRTFFPITSEYIEDDNILREFIGGSIYDN
jgi:uridine kinase